MNKYLLMTCAMLMALPAYATTDELIENVKNKNLTAVETLLAGGENVNAANAQGNTALHYAVATGNSEMVKLLLAHNADMNAANSKGWTPLKIAEKKNVGEVYNVLEEKIAADKAAAQAKAEKLKAEAEAKAKAEAEKLAQQKAAAEVKAKAEAEKLAQQKAKAEAKAKKEAEEKAQKIKEAQARIEAEKAALTQKAEKKKTEVKSTVKNKTAKAQIPLKKIETKAKPSKAPAKKVAKASAKKQLPQKKSPLSSKIYQGDEEVVYCLQYLGLQGEQKNMTVAAGFYAVDAGVNKTRHDVAVEEAKHYYENASAADIKNRADECGKYITPKQAAKQNQIIRSINKSIGI